MTVTCLCGSVLSEEFLSDLAAHPGTAKPCPNSACRHVHRFLPPNVVRTERSALGMPAYFGLNPEAATASE